MVIQATSVSLSGVNIRARAEERAAALGTELAAEAFVFSLAPDSSTHLVRCLVGRPDVAGPDRTASLSPARTKAPRPVP
jgi:hypothetical protein